MKKMGFNVFSHLVVAASERFRPKRNAEKMEEKNQAVQEKVGIYLKPWWSIHFSTSLCYIEKSYFPLPLGNGDIHTLRH